ncbi:MAG TPA: DUF6311 domain-containing protein [Acetobacteraceae bacterium]|nr:DUF6311 domain-containing protein [Acetobacteraceae bacterium]
MLQNGDNVPPHQRSGVDRLLGFLFKPRSVATLCALSACLGAGYALSVFPVSLVLGNGPFWVFPRGTIAGAGSGSADDIADALVGYLYLMRAPWALPVLYVPNLAAPHGTNIFWLDAVPWVSLFGKTVFWFTGLPVNLLGGFVFACFALPGVAMTALLATCGQRNICAAVAASIIAESAPFLWFGWGHLALSAQFLLIVALCLYCVASRRPGDRRVSLSWLALLLLTALTNLYLLAMVLGIWGAAFLQQCLLPRAAIRALVAEPLVIIASLVLVMLVTGILTPDLRSAGTSAFGVLSMNLASLIVPQMSGIVPGLAAYRVGMGMQHEGFAYLGLGVLLILATTVRSSLVWFRRNARRHVVGIALLALFFLFALSNKVYLGSHLLVEIPLPEPVTRALGTFRSSGRFIWPVGYALMAFGILQVLRSFRPGAALGILALACIIQFIDVRPLRALVAASAALPRAAVVDRQQTADIIRQAASVMVFPTYGCVRTAVRQGAVSALPPDKALELFGLDPFGRAEVSPADPRAVRVAIARREVLLQANMEIMLIAARKNRPVNSVYNARLATDCASEQRTMLERLCPGVAYFYLAGVPPVAHQSPGDACRRLGWLTSCLIPAAPLR